MTRSSLLLASTGAVLAVIAPPAHAESRYAARPPVVLSPDLAGPWIMQLRPSYRDVTGPVVYAPPTPREAVASRYAAPVRQAAVEPQDGRRTADAIDPKFLPTEVDWDGKQAPGTIVVDTGSRHLYLVQAGGKARRYGVGVGRPGFQWAGSHTITRKAEWPDWRPPAAMLKRKPELPHYMAGGPDNPLGARALYLGSTEYRIHGSNEPWTIGKAVSSGCIRMRNEDVTDLYGRVGVGTRVMVL
ncbi:MAG: L,D-transpeptidase [Siculibacillus sp.]|nr:L,D-transpeptidase [Siculibacillus sp.]